MALLGGVVSEGTSVWVGVSPEPLLVLPSSGGTVDAALDGRWADIDGTLSGSSSRSAYPATRRVKFCPADASTDQHS